AREPPHGHSAQRKQADRGGPQQIRGVAEAKGQERATRRRGLVHPEEDQEWQHEARGGAVQAEVTHERIQIALGNDQEQSHREERCAAHAQRPPAAPGLQLSSPLVTISTSLRREKSTTGSAS